MTESLNVSLSNTLSMFLSNFTMPGTGLALGGLWHPSRVEILTMAFFAGLFAMLHELACCFVWSSLTVWWIGKKSADLPVKR